MNPAHASAPSGTRDQVNCLHEGSSMHIEIAAPGYLSCGCNYQIEPSTCARH